MTFPCVQVYYSILQQYYRFTNLYNIQHLPLICVVRCGQGYCGDMFGA